MKPTDSQNESGEAPASRVPKLPGEEFHQSIAVAQLAVKLCELKKIELKWPSERAAARPEKFLEEAWRLIRRASEHVLRPATVMEIMTAGRWTAEALEKAIGAKLRIARPQTGAAQHYAFDQGVRLITGEKVLVRAMPLFRRFVRSRFEPEKISDDEKEKKAKSKIAQYQKNGFDYWRIELERDAFAKWKPGEKSRKAKQSRAARKK